MSDQEDPTSSEEPVVYVHEVGDDFTFYLDTRTNALRSDELGHITINDPTMGRGVVREGSAADPTHKKGQKRKIKRKSYGACGRIVVKDVVLKPGSLVDAADAFWGRLANEQDGAYKYLAGELRRDPENAKRLENLTGKDKKALLPLIDIALTKAPPTDFALQEWAMNIDLSDSQALIQSVPSQYREEFSKRIRLEKAFPELQWKSEGRGLICSSHGGKYLSVTFRKLSRKEGYAATPYTKDEKGQQQRKQRLFSLQEYCKELYEQVFEITNSTRHAHGLLVITGSTNSAKSEITRGLIDRYLREEGEARRRHLVTFEDPIERLFAVEDIQGPRLLAVEMSSTSGSVDYTPRQKQKDVVRLKDVLTDALRQTPAVVFVGETRNRKEWQLLLDFAATGHLIVTTAHAGSLVEAVHNIFEARNVTTRAQRSEVAHKLLGVVHLKGDSVSFIDEPLFKAPPSFTKKLKEEKQTLLSDYLCAQFELASSGLLEQCALDSADPAALLRLVNAANNLLKCHSLYEKERFKDIALSQETSELLSRKPEGEQLILLNRMLLEDAYPNDPGSKTNVVFPAVWRRTPRGVAALTADGLTSLLPHRSNNDAPSCVGRRWFIEKLIDGARHELDNLVDAEELKRIIARVYRRATGLDLRGE